MFRGFKTMKDYKIFFHSSIGFYPRANIYSIVYIIVHIIIV